MNLGLCQHLKETNGRVRLPSPSAFVKLGVKQSIKTASGKVFLRVLDKLMKSIYRMH